MKVIDLTGKRFGKLYVEQRDGKMYGQAAWKCKCDCGNYKTIAGDNLRRGCSVSCGCNWKRYGKENPLYTGYEELRGSVWCRIRTGALIRKLEFSITIEEAWNLFEKQNRKCALTGLDIYMSKGSSDKKRKMCTASLDRIDSTKGYIKGNIQWVHKKINQIKMDLQQHEFIYMCHMVARNNKFDDNHEIEWDKLRTFKRKYKTKKNAKDVMNA